MSNHKSPSWNITKHDSEPPIYFETEHIATFTRIEQPKLIVENFKILVIWMLLNDWNIIVQKYEGCKTSIIKKSKNNITLKERLKQC